MRGLASDIVSGLASIGRYYKQAWFNNEYECDGPIFAESRANHHSALRFEDSRNLLGGAAKKGRLKLLKLVELVVTPAIPACG